MSKPTGNRLFNHLLATTATANWAYNKFNTQNAVNYWKPEKSSGPDPVYEENMARRVYKRRRVGASKFKRRRKSRRSGLRRRVAKLSRTMYRKGLNKVEIKYTQGVVNERTSSVIGNAATRLQFTNIAGGTENNKRIGKRVFLRHLYLKWFFEAGGVGGTSARNEQYVRVMVIRHTNIQVNSGDWGGVNLQANAPPLVDMLDYNGVSGENDLRLHYFKNIGNRWQKGFVIVYNKLVKLSRETGSEKQMKVFKKRLAIFKTCDWADNTQGTLVGPNQLLLYAYDNETSANPIDHPTMKLYYRLSYTDV